MFYSTQIKVIHNETNIIPQELKILKEAKSQQNMQQALHPR